MTEEEFLRAYLEGCRAMQARICAWLMAKGRLDIAPDVLAMQPPEYREPERWTVSAPTRTDGEGT